LPATSEAGARGGRETTRGRNGTLLVLALRLDSQWVARMYCTRGRWVGGLAPLVGILSESVTFETKREGGGGGCDDNHRHQQRHIGGCTILKSISVIDVPQNWRELRLWHVPENVTTSCARQLDDLVMNYCTCSSYLFWRSNLTRHDRKRPLFLAALDLTFKLHNRAADVAALSSFLCGREAARPETIVMDSCWRQTSGE